MLSPFTTHGSQCTNKPSPASGYHWAPGCIVCEVADSWATLIPACSSFEVSALAAGAFSARAITQIEQSAKKRSFISGFIVGAENEADRTSVSSYFAGGRWRYGLIAAATAWPSTCAPAGLQWN